MAPVPLNISPRLTNGDTSPPNAKPAAPNNAEAVPEFSLANAIANVVDEVKVNPIINNNPTNNPSYTQKSQFVFKAKHSIAAKTTIPVHPAKVTFSGLLNLTDKPAATPIAKEFNPNTTLNITAEKP